MVYTGIYTMVYTTFSQSTHDGLLTQGIIQHRVVNGLYIWYLTNNGSAVTISNWSAFCGGVLFEIGAYVTAVEASHTAHPPPDPHHPSTIKRYRVFRLRQKRHYLEHKETIAAITLNPDYPNAAFFGSLIQLAAATIFGEESG